MIERFLRYSLEHQRKISLMIADDKGFRRVQVQVVRIETESFAYVTGRSSKEKRMPLLQVLSAAYARGDEGDTLKNERREWTNRD